VPRRPEHGDYATNLALVLGSKKGERAMDIAKGVLENLADPKGYLERVEVAPPGFINLFLNRGKLLEKVKEVVQEGVNYGRSSLQEEVKVLVEFVSANPTGPLHVGHGRGAALGSALANLLEAAGYKVTKEYYVNDMGRQMEVLGRSLYIRYLQLLGEDVDMPEDHYRGEYMVDLAKELFSLFGDELRGKEEVEALEACRHFASSRILEGIRKDLEEFRVTYDRWFHESSLYEEGRVQSHLERLREKGLVYERDGAQWFKSTEFGDEKDRVVVRKDGRTTYLASDIAYHADKLERGYQRLVDIWGADHHGYVPRMKGVMQALGADPSCLNIVLVQMVSLLRDGIPVAMSTRAGEFATLREVMEEVGVDAARYIFLMRSPDSHLDFDLELAKKQEKENPVYYVQYAHARICSIEREARERGVELPKVEEADLTLLQLPEEWELIKQIVGYPDLVREAAEAMEPHRLTFFLDGLAAQFHAYYNRGWLEPQARVICPDPELTKARLLLVRAVKQVLWNALTILGVSAPEKM
jgi:arginyl-tRNA synthetase